MKNLFILFCTSRTAKPIVLVPEERGTLQVWARSRNLSYRKVLRARIFLMAADGGFESRHWEGLEGFEANPSALARAFSGLASGGVGEG